MFSTFDQSTESRNRRAAALFGGLLAQGVFISAAVFFGLIFPSELPPGDRRYTRVWLSALRPPEKPLAEPPPPVARLVVPKLRPPRIPQAPELPVPVVARLDPPKTQPTIPPAPVREVALPAPPAAPAMPPPKPHDEVHTGLFAGGAPEPVTTRRPVEQVQTGGFGNPQGLPSQAQGESRGNVPKLGSFGLPDGPGRGNGIGGSRGVQGVVASAGFGSGVANVAYDRQGSGTEAPKVALGGFEKAPPVAPAATNLHEPLPVAFQPVEILSKPSPVYTEEARRSGIQGEVALSVIFQAGGTIRVLGVVKSLGHGLDQAAEQAATQIHFKPAQRDGRAADFPATLRIEFRLADQST